MAVDLGARNEAALVIEVTLPRATYPSSDRIREFYDRLRGELRSIPGIAEVGSTNYLPGSTKVIIPSHAMVLEGQPLRSDQVDRNALRLSATPGYFAAIGIDVLAGRAFTEADRPGTTPVAIVSEGFAWAFELQPVQIIGRRMNAGLGKERLAEIIGVVRDVRMRGPESDLQPAMYLPFAQTSINATGYVVTKAGTRPQDLIPSIRRAIGRIDPVLPIYNVRPFDDVRSDYLASRQFAMATVLAFGTVACGLAALGLYGVISYMVRLRAREIGIRIAIGASPAAVRREVIGSGVFHATGGIAIGIAFALSLSRFISAYVPGLGQVDAAGLAALAAMTFIVSIGVSWFPARRAARVDPLVALRYE
jgi:putative ABC transport system permease protein